jgi:VIT1/CCC1 family predicted Fe2+/Mn2+ transporter
MIVLVFVILALLCFLVGTVNIQPPGTRQINWMSAGLALLALAYLVRGA